jgi:glutamate formiminotransferase
MKNNTVLAIVFLMAGTLLTTTAITTMVPAAYADNKNKAEDESAAATADCDDNDVERAGFDCFGIAANDIDVDLGEGMVLGFVDGIPSVYPSN